MNELSVPEDFIKENKANLGQFMPKSRKRGPYSKHDKLTRRSEVYRLHFEYGYSARRIAEMMKVNRNTINGDIQYLYGQVIKNYNMVDPRIAIIKQINKLEIQKTRLREQLDKTKNHSERISIERLLFDIDSKIIHIRIKISESNYQVHRMATKWLNDHLEKNQKEKRYLTLSDTSTVSISAYEKINKIIKEEQNRCMFR